MKKAYGPIFLSFLVLLIGCSTQPEFKPHYLKPGATSLTKFTHEEYELYTKRVQEWENAQKQYNQEQYEKRRKKEKKKGFLKFLSSIGKNSEIVEFEGLEEVTVTGAMGTSSVPPSSASITNNQVSNVDEGGIVKRIGDYFLMLRQDRLSSISINYDGQGQLKHIDTINVAVPGKEKLDAWFDEILVHGSTIILLGYVYDLDAIQYSFFEISDKGKLSHTKSFYVEAYDYYSEDNYASRIHNGQLIFYMPIPLWSYMNDGAIGFDELSPRIVNAENLEIPENKFRSAKEFWQFREKVMNKGGRPIAVNNVYEPIVYTHDPIAHAIVTCPVSEFPKDCESTVIVGEYLDEFYINEEYAYLWLAAYGKALDANTVDFDAMYNSIKSGEVDKWKYEEVVGLYRVKLDHSSVELARGYGHPFNQFSFYDYKDSLYVLTTETYKAQPWKKNSEEINELHLIKFTDDSFAKGLTVDAQVEMYQVPKIEGETINLWSGFTPIPRTV